MHTQQFEVRAWHAKSSLTASRSQKSRGSSSTVVCMVLKCSSQRADAQCDDDLLQASADFWRLGTVQDSTLEIYSLALECGLTKILTC